MAVQQSCRTCNDRRLSDLVSVMGYAVGKTIEAIARQPEAKGDCTRTMFIGVAMAESTGIYAFVVALILLFANPFIGKL